MFHSAQLHDISQSGMRFVTNVVQSGSLHIFHPDPTASEQSHLEIEVPDGEQTLTLTGKVVWYDRNPEGNPYSFRVGIEFVNIPSEDQKRILSLIKRSLASPSSPSPEGSSPASSE